MTEEKPNMVRPLVEKREKKKRKEKKKQTQKIPDTKSQNKDVVFKGNITEVR